MLKVALQKKKALNNYGCLSKTAYQKKSKQRQPQKNSPTVGRTNGCFLYKRYGKLKEKGECNPSFLPIKKVLNFKSVVSLPFRTQQA